LIVSGDPSEIKIGAAQEPKDSCGIEFRSSFEYRSGTSFFRWAERYTLTAANGYTLDSNLELDLSTLAPKGSKESIDIPWDVQDRLAGGPVVLRME